MSKHGGRHFEGENKDNAKPSVQTCIGKGRWNVRRLRKQTHSRIHSSSDRLRRPMLQEHVPSGFNRSSASGHQMPSVESSKGLLQLKDPPERKCKRVCLSFCCHASFPHAIPSGLLVLVSPAPCFFHRKGSKNRSNNGPPVGGGDRFGS